MFTVEKMDVWCAKMDDRPGALKDKLEHLAMAGADLGFIIARRIHEEPGKGLVFLTPIKGEKQMAAARAIGFKTTDTLHSLRVEGPDEPGLAYRISARLAQEAINVRGVSAASLGNEFVMFLAFDTAAEAERAKDKLALPV